MLLRGVSGCVESANRPNRERDRSDNPDHCDNKGVAPNTVISDLSETEIGVARVGAADLPAVLANKTTVFEKRLLLLLSNGCQLY